MHRIKLTVAYDGTNYCGWQVQPNGVSIQSTLQKAIENLLGVKTDVTGASRIGFRGACPWTGGGF